MRPLRFLAGAAVMLSLSLSVSVSADGPSSNQQESSNDIVMEKTETVHRWQNDGRGEVRHYARIRVLTEAGRKAVGQFYFTYSSQLEELQVECFRTLKRDGSVIPADTTQVLELASPSSSSQATLDMKAAAGSKTALAGRRFETVARRAKAAREANKLSEAIGLYRKALELRPRWDEGWWYLGTLHYESDQYAEALPAFRSLAGLRPKMGAAWAMLGLCEFQTGDFKNSLIHLRRGRALGLGDNREVLNVTRYHEALLLNLDGEFEAATELLAALLANGVLSEKVRVALGLALLRVQLLPEQVDPSKDALVRAAGEAAGLVAMNNFDEAERAFQKLLGDFPNAPFVHYAYGSALATLSRYEEAEREFRAEMKITPESALPPMQLAHLFLRTKRHREALPLAQAAVRIAPRAFPAHYLLGRTMLELGDLAEATKELELARQLGPYSPEVRYHLARAYAKAHRSAEAARERSEFARLNALLERARGQRGAQSYRSSSDRATFQPRQANEPALSTPR